MLHRSLGISKVEVYPVDTYEMWLEGYDRNGLYRKFEFEIIRFGVHERADGSHHTVGLEAGKRYEKLRWHSSYLGSGGWVLKKSYLIHAGPDSADIPVAAIGCAEVMYGKWGFFKSKLRELSGFEEDDLSSDVKISGAGKFTAIVEAEKKPALPEPIKR